MKPSLLDTDTLSFYMKGYTSVVDNVISYLSIYPTLNISYITYYEILRGLEYKQASRQISEFETLVKKINLINISISSLQISSKIFGDLKSKGKISGTSDILIAGIAIGNNLELVTNNTKHFESIEKLQINNWKG